MGPRSVERGKPVPLFAVEATLPASMGPRSVERGKLPMEIEPRIALSGFNGAAFC